MKTTSKTSKKIALGKQTLRHLGGGSLTQVIGGRPWSGGHTCSPTDNCI